MKNFSITSFFADFARNEEGAQILEYALIVAVVSLGLIAAMSTDKIGFDAWVTKVQGLLSGTPTPTPAN